jgi:hypothetical protein
MTALLRRIRDMLVATADDPTTALLRAVLLEGRAGAAATHPVIR